MSYAGQQDGYMEKTKLLSGITIFRVVQPVITVAHVKANFRLEPKAYDL